MVLDEQKQKVLLLPAFNCRGKQHMEKELENYKKDDIKIKG